MGNESLTEQIRQSSKREFLDRWLLPNKDTVWHVAPYKIAVDCAEDLEQKIENLTASINKASKSSTVVGIGLWAVGSATWFLLLLEIYKTFFK